MNLMPTILIMVLIVFALMNLFSSMTSKTNTNMQKKIEFECGFNMMTKNRLPFSMQFFLITILFLIFDLEIAMIMPIINEKTKMMNAINMLNFTLIILTIGLMVEWNQGLVEWTK